MVMISKRDQEWIKKSGKERQSMFRCAVLIIILAVDLDFLLFTVSKATVRFQNST